MVYRYVSILEKEKQMLEELGEHGIVILVYLYVHGKAYISEIQKKLGIGAVPLYRALAVLYKLRLVEEEKRFPRKYLKLTEEGREVAELLVEAEKKLIAVAEKHGIKPESIITQ
ncbi:MAG: hypothetical protein DRJ38_10705 [Thermoprotei archaeon]|nr:MAG: hypothetical protein DRJ38_10705 [Thermoprotei archaeon]